MGLSVHLPSFCSLLNGCAIVLVKALRESIYQLLNCKARLGGSVGCTSDWRPGGRRFDLRRGRQHSFLEIDREIFSMVIFSLPLIQEGQLSVSSERMCTILVNRLED